MRGRLGCGAVDISLTCVSLSTSRVNALVVFLYAPAKVCSAGMARFDCCALKYSKGVSSARPVALRYTWSFGLRTNVGEVAAKWHAPAIAISSGFSLAAFTPDMRGFIIIGCFDSTTASASRGAPLAGAGGVKAFWVVPMTKGRMLKLKR